MEELEKNAETDRVCHIIFMITDTYFVSYEHIILQE